MSEDPRPYVVTKPVTSPGTANDPTTPVTEQGVRAFFEGLAALEKTLTYGRLAEVAVAITPSLAQLIEQFCRSDPRYGRVMGNIYVKIESYTDIRSTTR